MAPKRKLSDFEAESRKLQERAAKVLFRGRLQWINSQLKESPAHTASVVRLLIKRGCCKEGLPKGFSGVKGEPDDDQDSDDGVENKPASKAVKCEPESASPNSVKDEENGDGDDEPTPDGKSAPLPTIPRKYHTLEELPTSYLQQMLPAINPRVLSRHALRALVCAGKKAIRKEPMLHLIEYLCNLPKDWLIPSEMRVMARLLTALSKLAKARGELSDSVQLPMDWLTAGHYLVEKDNGSWVITLKALDKRAAIDISMFKATDADEIVLTVEMNWSLQSAKRKLAVSPPNGVGIGCAFFFPNEPYISRVGLCADTPVSSRRKKSLKQQESPVRRNFPQVAGGMAVPVGTDAALAAGADSGVQQQQDAVDEYTHEPLED